MDKCFIIRIYKKDKETVVGIVEDVERHKREKFNTSDQLWSFITRNPVEKSFCRSNNQTKLTIRRKRTSDKVIYRNDIDESQEDLHKKE